jgi:hypothetical protein
MDYDIVARNCSENKSNAVKIAATFSRANQIIPRKNIDQREQTALTEETSPSYMVNLNLRAYTVATAAQIEANCRNVQKSSGAKTDNGKARARINALKHVRPGARSAYAAAGPV